MVGQGDRPYNALPAWAVLDRDAARHAPRSPCAPAGLRHGLVSQEAPDLTWAFRSQVHDDGIMCGAFAGGAGSKGDPLCMTWPGSAPISQWASAAARRC